MLIKEENREKIEKMIKAAEGRATTRLLTWKDIQQAIQNVEIHLGIAKKDLVGVYVDVDVNAQDFPNAYKYTPHSTQFTMVRKKSGWDLVSVERYTTRRPNSRYIVELTEEAKAAIIRKMSCFT